MTAREMPIWAVPVSFLEGAVGSHDDPDHQVAPEAIQFLREHFGLSRGALARMLGVSTATITAWEADTRAPNERRRNELKLILFALDQLRLRGLPRRQQQRTVGGQA